MNIKTLMRMSSYFLSTLPKFTGLELITADTLNGTLLRRARRMAQAIKNVFDIKAKKKFETISFQTSFSCFVTPIGFKPITF